MGRGQKILFYCIMAFMTLAVIEGMAQAAYYIAYGEFNGGGRLAATGDAEEAEYLPQRERWRIPHPYYGHTASDEESALNQAQPPRRQDGVVLIGLLGGSLSRFVAKDFRNALETWFRDNDIPGRPVVLALGYSAAKQPYQAIVIANTLILGGEYDIIVNLDGHNELTIPHTNYFEHEVSPFYPLRWHLMQQQRLTDTQKVLISRIYALRQREQRLAALATTEPWRWSALYGIVNRYLLERAKRQILALNYELSGTQSGEYSLERYGPIWPAEPDDAVAPDGDDLSRQALRVWYRGSALLHDMSRAAGAEYYHFLQPNQYVPASKPLSDSEQAVAYDPENRSIPIYRDSYPLLLRLGDELRRQGVNYYDLTQIFAENRETLYRDNCCHLNERGNELLAESMVQRLAPALRNRAALAAARVGGGGGGNAMTAGTALDAAIRESSPVHAVNKLYFNVRLSDDAGMLHYSREDCRPADTATPFFVRIAPVDAADLLPGRAESGYNSYDFSFDRDGGMIDAAGRCVVEYQLPEYGIANVLTGQYVRETGQTVWQARITLDFGFGVARPAAGTLRYSRTNCLPVHIATRFFLHITPVDEADLPPHRIVYGYDNADFPGYHRNDRIIDAAGRCVVERELPGYDIASIMTGQYIPETGRRLWETRIDFEQP